MARNEQPVSVRMELSEATVALYDEVTLVIDRWAEVAPGVLTFACVDVSTARRVARAMRNALSWFVVQGRVTPDEALSAQARGEVLCASVRPPATVRLSP